MTTDEFARRVAADDWAGAGTVELGTVTGCGMDEAAVAVAHEHIRDGTFRDIVGDWSCVDDRGLITTGLRWIRCNAATFAAYRNVQKIEAANGPD
jgi:hypothetical protein